jgi:hypothetical protein
LIGSETSKPVFGLILWVAPDCVLEPDEWTDGDSFRVRLPDSRFETFRLYFVDTTESRSRGKRSDEQAAQFALTRKRIFQRYLGTHFNTYSNTYVDSYSNSDTNAYTDTDAMHGKMFTDAKAQAYASSPAVSTFN